MEYTNKFHPRTRCTMPQAAFINTNTITNIIIITIIIIADTTTVTITNTIIQSPSAKEGEFTHADWFKRTDGLSDNWSRDRLPDLPSPRSLLPAILSAVCFLVCFVLPDIFSLLSVRHTCSVRSYHRPTLPS
jgi:hypothetical protein